MMVDVGQLGRVATQLLAQNIKSLAGQGLSLVAARGVMEALKGVSSKDIKNLRYMSIAVLAKKAQAKDRKRRIRDRHNAPMQAGEESLVQEKETGRALADSKRPAKTQMERGEKQADGEKDTLKDAGEQKQAGEEAEKQGGEKQADGEKDTLKDAGEQKQATRKMSALRRVAKPKQTGEIGEPSLSDLKSMQDTIKHLQNVYRVINGASAATIWGLILTFIIMNCQLFLGNGLRIPKIPKLNGVEMGLLALVDFIILMAALVQTFIIAMIASIV